MFLQALVNLLVAALLASRPSLARSEAVSIRMPDVRPDHGEQYLCTAVRLPVDTRGHFIVGFDPKANTNRVHHMLVYGCQMPGLFERDSPRLVWDCGEMHTTDEDSSSNEVQSFEQAPICRGNLQMIYGWAMDAPALHLPESVGFKVGEPQSGIHYLVLQVHYGHYHAFKQNPSLTDNSGLLLELKPNDYMSGITKQAGVLLLISSGQVLPGKSKHEIWCDIKDDIEIHPFRFRVHTHKLGTRVVGAKLHPSARSTSNYQLLDRRYKPDEWIGIGDPQKPQMFYPVIDKNLTLRRGDKVYAACEFNNNQSHAVSMGPTAEDEMCNFYMMYWTDSSRLLSDGACFGYNPALTP